LATPNCKILQFIKEKKNEDAYYCHALFGVGKWNT
jgi:hypothetical protein